MIDCSHGNSQKDHRRQARRRRRRLREQVAAGSWQIFGAMLESHLVEGRQDYVPGAPGRLRPEHHRRLHLARADRAAARAAGQGAAAARIDRPGLARSRIRWPTRPRPAPGPIDGFAIAPPIEPMLAKLADDAARPATASSYEPKWDGFRAIVFRGGDDVFIQSRDLRPLDRYFPELHDAAARRRCRPAASSTARSSSPTPRGLDFDALQLRLHPAASRVAKLAAETPVVVRRLRSARRRRPATSASVPQRERRARLERLLAGRRAAAPPDADDARSRARRRVARRASKAPASTA